VDRVTVVAHHLRIGTRAVTLLEGPAGWGELSPFDGYPCDPDAAMRAAHEAATVGFPPARRSEVTVNALVTGPGFDPEILAGYPAVKVKLRSPDELDLVARVREAVNPRVSIRVDANAAWDVDTAVSVLARLVTYDIELVEQPVSTLDDLARVRRQSPIPIAADESVRSVADARRLRQLDAADVVVLKVQPLGGVRTALDVAAEAGVPALPTSMLETSVGLAAGLALACALPALTFACGLGTASALEGDVTDEPLVAHDGRLVLRTIVPDPALLERYRVPSPSTQVVSS
jgi:O-succinylbenzoate synthase